jgi:hypothetical protein
MLKWVFQKQVTYVFMKLSGSGQIPAMDVCEDCGTLHLSLKKLSLLREF